MTLTDAISTLRISQVWTALGGASLRHGRGRAFWRQSADGFNVALDDRKNVWHDKVSNAGGGVLDLIRLRLGCDRAGAVSWLAETFAIDIDQARTLTATEKRNYARARREAEQFIAWRADALEAMRERRNFHLACYHGALRLIVNHSLNHPMAEIWMDGYEQHQQRYLRLDEEINAFAMAPEADLLPMFYREFNRRSA